MRQILKTIAMDEKQISNLLFVGCTILGVGVGMFLHMIAIGAVIGVGLGFIIKAIYLHGRNNQT